MSTRSWMLVTGSILLLCVMGSAPAGASGAPRAHDGFFLRLSGGGGYANPSIHYLGQTFDVSGGTGDLNLAVGGMVARNLALHGTILTWTITDPAVGWKGVGSIQVDGEVTMAGVGAGLTYYLMPANVYVSGSVAGGSLTVNPDNGPSGETKDGFVMDLTLGKEWWVGDAWGLGVAGALGFYSIPEKGIDENWKGASLALRFSATLN